MLEKGSATLIQGMQFGDEGKGKLIDVLSKEADFVFRVQGGHNAGHTIWVSGKKIFTQLIPSGVLHEKTMVGIGAGVVVDPVVFLSEIEKIKESGVSLDASRLALDYRCPIILPFHRLMDKRLEEEKQKASGKSVGTTGKGIGPSYATRATRQTMRVVEFIDDTLRENWFQNQPSLLEGLSESERSELSKLAEKIKPYVQDVAHMANKALKENKKVLLEGAQGVQLDVSFGTYPFVTSSNLVAGSCAGGVGIAPWAVKKVVGVFKTYSTRVGNGPYVGELSGPFADELRKRGHEFGTVTGRPRSVGWLDLVSLKYFCELCGITDLAAMKSDCLTGIDNIGMVVDYVDKNTGESFGRYPMTVSEWERVEPVLEFTPMFSKLTEDDGKTLSPNFKAFLDKISEFTETSISYVSLGPDREEGLMMKV